MIDFTNSETLLCDYGGSEKKKKIIYNGDYYLLKFPDPIRDKDNRLSYMNNVFSEYVGSNIFKICKVNVQEVLLGTYKETKEKVVVACRDFTDKDNKLVELSDISNSITSLDRKITTDIRDIYETFDLLDYSFNKEEVISNFFDVFVMDTLIGNTDRHLSNIGYLVNSKKLVPSPVYDCGSSLNPLLSESEMADSLKDDTLFKNIACSLYPVYRYYGKRLSYKEFYDEGIKDLNEALIRVYPNIDLGKINKFIDDIEGMSDIRKEYYKKSIAYRKKYILDIAYAKISQ